MGDLTISNNIYYTDERNTTIPITEPHGYERTLILPREQQYDPNFVLQISQSDGFLPQLPLHPNQKLDLPADIVTPVYEPIRFQPLDYKDIALSTHNFFERRLPKVLEGINPYSVDLINAFSPGYTILRHPFININEAIRLPRVPLPSTHHPIISTVIKAIPTLLHFLPFHDNEIFSQIARIQELGVNLLLRLYEDIITHQLTIENRPRQATFLQQCILYIRSDLQNVSARILMNKRHNEQAEGMMQVEYEDHDPERRHMDVENPARVSEDPDQIISLYQYYIVNINDATFNSPCEALGVYFLLPQPRQHRYIASADLYQSVRLKLRALILGKSPTDPAILEQLSDANIQRLRANIQGDFQEHLRRLPNELARQQADHLAQNPDSFFNQHNIPLNPFNDTLKNFRLGDLIHPSNSMDLERSYDDLTDRVRAQRPHTYYGEEKNAALAESYGSSISDDYQVRDSVRFYEDSDSPPAFSASGMSSYESEVSYRAASSESPSVVPGESSPSGVSEQEPPPEVDSTRKYVQKEIIESDKLCTMKQWLSSDNIALLMHELKKYHSTLLSIIVTQLINIETPISRNGAFLNVRYDDILHFIFAYCGTILHGFFLGFVELSLAVCLESIDESGTRVDTPLLYALVDLLTRFKELYNTPLFNGLFAIYTRQKYAFEAKKYLNSHEYTRMIQEYDREALFFFSPSLKSVVSAITRDLDNALNEIENFLTVQIPTFTDELANQNMELLHNYAPTFVKTLKIWSNNRPYFDDVRYKRMHVIVHNNIPARELDGYNPDEFSERLFGDDDEKAFSPEDEKAFSPDDEKRGFDPMEMEHVPLSGEDFIGPREKLLSEFNPEPMQCIDIRLYDIHHTIYPTIERNDRHGDPLTYDEVSNLLSYKGQLPIHNLGQQHMTPILIATARYLRLFYPDSNFWDFFTYTEHPPFRIVIQLPLFEEYFNERLRTVTFNALTQYVVRSWRASVIPDIQAQFSHALNEHLLEESSLDANINDTLLLVFTSEALMLDTRSELLFELFILLNNDPRHPLRRDDQFYFEDEKANPFARREHL